MCALSGRCFVGAATIANVPYSAVVARCLGKRIPLSRASEIAKEASAEAYRRSLEHEFSNFAHYCRWVRRTACNYAVDLLRQESKAVSLTWIEELESQTNDGSKNRELVLQGLESLSERDRLILKMTYEDELTLDEIVERLLPKEDGSANAKRLRIVRSRDAALATLRSFLLNHGYGSGDEP